MVTAKVGLSDRVDNFLLRLGLLDDPCSWAIEDGMHTGPCRTLSPAEVKLIQERHDAQKEATYYGK